MKSEMDGWIEILIQFCLTILSILTLTFIHNSYTEPRAATLFFLGGGNITRNFPFLL